MAPPLLIENGTLLSTGGVPAVLRRHSVLIEKGLIKRVAPAGGFSRFQGRRLDASGKVVMPGLINAHHHFYSTLARGLPGIRPARDFSGVLKNLWWRLDRALTAEDCYSSALISLLESIRHGTTTIVDHHASPRCVTGSLETIAAAVRETCLRACLCYEVSDRDGPRVAAEGMEENAAFIRRCREGRDGRVSALFGLHASFTLSDATLEKAAHLGRGLRTGFHIHVAEGTNDQESARRVSRMGVVDRLNRFGILGKKSIAAHCIHINRKEMDVLALTGTAAVHNPQSNMNNAVGTANVIELVRRGVLVGLGTDAMTTNMLEELRVALWGQRLASGNPSAGFAEVAAALFENNAEIAGRTFGLRFGEIREGFVADLAIFDYDPPTPLESANLFGHALFGISQAPVSATVAGGQVLMENGKLGLNLDVERAYARAREQAANLWKRL